MPMPFPPVPYEPTVFGKFEAIKEHPDLLFTEPMGYANLYVLVDLKDRLLWTNCLTNNEGEVCTSNYTECLTSIDFSIHETEDGVLIRFTFTMARSDDSGVLVLAERLE